ncbi:MAG: hypothetical protein OEV53_03145 [Nitrospira sp.]|nr:hypothetical protein [Nitrospira sp.]
MQRNVELVEETASPVDEGTGQRADAVSAGFHDRAHRRPSGGPRHDEVGDGAAGKPAAGVSCVAGIGLFRL